MQGPNFESPPWPKMQLSELYLGTLLDFCDVGITYEITLHTNHRRCDGYSLVCYSVKEQLKESVLELCEAQDKGRIRMAAVEKAGFL